MLRNLFISFLLAGVMWAIFIINQVFPMDFNTFGIIPRTTHGLWGIVCAPFLHANIHHIVSNSWPIIILTFVLLQFYDNLAFRVWTGSAVLGGFLVWAFARSAVHIGASGVIFSLLGFLMASGIFRGSLKSFIIGIIIFFLYGGCIWGVLPNQEGVSWESHLFGFIAGIFLARHYRKFPSKSEELRNTDNDF